MISAVKKFLIW